MIYFLLHDCNSELEDKFITGYFSYKKLASVIGLTCNEEEGI